MFGCFFGPALKGQPEFAHVTEKRPDDAILVCRFGDLSVQDGTWQILGHGPETKTDCWPLRRFVRRDDLAKVAFRVKYDDMDPNVVVSERSISEDEARSLDTDRVCGTGAVELILTRLPPSHTTK